MIKRNVPWIQDLEMKSYEEGNEKEEIHRNYEEVNSQAQEITTLCI